MAVGISSALLDRLIAEAAASPCLEVCGLLFGSVRQIDSAVACRNVASDPATVFEVDPVALIAAHKAMRGGGPQLIGHYHSHPNGTSAPSPRDALAAGSGDLWLIIGSGTAQLWRAATSGAWLERFDPVTLMPTPPCAPGPASS